MTQREMIKNFAAIMAISASMLGAAAAQTNPAAAKPGVAHGVSNQYEQVDGFPFYDTRTVRVSNGSPYYEPAEITVEVGDTVRWMNQPLSDAHTIIDAGGRFTSRAIPAGQDYCHHFVREGEYTYTCRFHPWMKGVVHVRRRELSLHPLAELPDGATLVRRAAFLAIHPEAIEDGQDTFWMPGAQLTTLERSSLAQSPGETLTVSEAGGRLVPLVAVAQKLMVAAYGELLVIDPSSGKVLDRFQLPRDLNLARGANLAEGQLWASADDGKTLVFADTINRIIRTRMLPDEARIVALRPGTPGTVWALDAGRRMLLKLSADWFTEIPLPATLSGVNSVAVDRQNNPWVAAPDSGIVATVANGGQVAEFSVSANAPVGLLQLFGTPELLVSIGTDSERTAVVREELGNRNSAAQKEPSCEGPAGLEIKQSAGAAEPRQERRPQ
jgi:plastocyanin